MSVSQIPTFRIETMAPDLSLSFDSVNRDMSLLPRSEVSLAARSKMQTEAWAQNLTPDRPEQFDMSCWPERDSNDRPALNCTVAVFANNSHVRRQICDDIINAGFRVTCDGDITQLLEGEQALCDVVLVDCPTVDSKTLAALGRLDMRAKAAGAEIIVSTGVDSLDDVFGALDQSDPQFLVTPVRSERLLAFGRALTRVPTGHVREVADEQRVMLIRLAEQISNLATRLENMDSRLLPSTGQAMSALSAVSRTSTSSPLTNLSHSFGAPEASGYGTQESVATAGATQTRQPAPPLPDAQLVRRMIRHRQARARFLDGELFADPAWDMLLDLTAAHVENVRVSVTSLCIASGVAPTTALRWIGQMTQAGWLDRTSDEIDRRRIFVSLTERAVDSMARYFSEVSPGILALV